MFRVPFIKVPFISEKDIHAQAEDSYEPSLSTNRSWGRSSAKGEHVECPDMSPKEKGKGNEEEAGRGTSQEVMTP